MNRTDTTESFLPRALLAGLLSLVVALPLAEAHALPLGAGGPAAREALDGASPIVEVARRGGRKASGSKAQARGSKGRAPAGRPSRSGRVKAVAPAMVAPAAAAAAGGQSTPSGAPPAAACGAVRDATFVCLPCGTGDNVQLFECVSRRLQSRSECTLPATDPQCLK